jgi:predicted dithiol-disulfide oxidoreductase (DUF899 family)
MGHQERIQALDDEIRAKIEERNKLMLSSEPEPVEDSTLIDRKGNSVKLSELFGDKEELLLIHNMGKGCVYCIMWADGFRGDAEHIQDRMAMVLTSPDKPEIMAEFANSRNWNFPVASFHGTDFARNLGFTREKDGKTYYQPGVSALIKQDGKIYRTAKDYFGPGDLYCPPWQFFKLFPKGYDDWGPKYSYP